MFTVTRIGQLFVWSRTVRDALVWEAGARSKLLVQVDAVLAVGIHEVWSFATPRTWLKLVVGAFDLLPVPVLPERWLHATGARVGTTYVLEPEAGLTFHYSTSRKDHWIQAKNAKLYRAFVRTCRAMHWAQPLARALTALPDSLTEPVYTGAALEELHV